MAGAIVYGFGNIGVAELGDEVSAATIEEIEGATLGVEFAGCFERESDDLRWNFRDIIVEATASAGAEIVGSIQSAKSESAIADDGDSRVEIVFGDEFLEQGVAELELLGAHGGGFFIEGKTTS